MLNELSKAGDTENQIDVLCSHAETVSAMHDAEHRALQGRVTWPASLSVGAIAGPTLGLGW
jgi:hypothetical protein